MLHCFNDAQFNVALIYCLKLFGIIFFNLALFNVALVIVLVFNAALYFVPLFYYRTTI